MTPNAALLPLGLLPGRGLRPRRMRRLGRALMAGALASSVAGVLRLILVGELSGQPSHQPLASTAQSAHTRTSLASSAQNAQTQPANKQQRAGVYLLIGRRNDVYR
jgi:hypothetical protein